MNTVIRRILAAALTLLALAACSRRQTIIPDTDFTGYVSAYSGGVIPEDGTIRIQLAFPAEARPENGLFSFSPSLDGSLRWVSGDMVEFVPDQGALVPGRTYKASFDLSKVRTVRDKKYKTF